ncbi:MAG: hypothetical protein Q4B70_12810 [Lachnospiraceae bacterium]|nr:hypothetical protein [Lachnospiraceae bacterium]
MKNECVMKPLKEMTLLDGDDSKTKLKLGRTRQTQTGRMYRYFMVFKDKELGMDGAYTLDKFVEVLKKL